MVLSHLGTGIHVEGEQIRDFDWVLHMGASSCSLEHQW